MKEGWLRKTLGEVCHVYQPETISQKQMAGGEFPVYGANGQIGWHNQFNHHEARLILGCRGSCGSVHFTKPRAWINGNAMVVEPKPGVIDPFFLAYALKGGIDLADAITGTAQPQITRTSLMPLAITLPESLPEQQRIVALLDEAFAALATAQAHAARNLQNARALFDSQLQSVFSQRGEGWVVRRLEELCVVDWGNTDLTKSSFVEGGEFLAVSAAGCDGRIGHKEHERFTPVLSAIGAQCGRMFLPEEDFTAIKNAITMTPLKGACTGKFLYRLLTSVKLPKRGAAQPFIAKGDINTFEVSIPVSEDDQARIAQELEILEAETQRLAQIYEQKQAALAALKQALLHQAFNGEL